jgi:hypothetical protein
MVAQEAEGVEVFTLKPSATISEHQIISVFAEIFLRRMLGAEIKRRHPRPPLGGAPVCPRTQLAKSPDLESDSRRFLPFAANADHTSAWGETHSDSASQRLTRCFERIFVRASQMRPNTMPNKSIDSVMSSWKTIHPMIARPCSPHPAWQPMV